MNSMIQRNANQCYECKVAIKQVSEQPVKPVKSYFWKIMENRLCGFLEIRILTVAAILLKLIKERDTQKLKQSIQHHASLLEKN